MTPIITWTLVGILLFFAFAKEIHDCLWHIRHWCENKLKELEKPSVPKHISEWLAVNQYHLNHPIVQMLKCPKCGGWFDSIDYLAPYHWEMCWCEKCNAHTRIPNDEGREEAIQAGVASKDKG